MPIWPDRPDELTVAEIVAAQGLNGDVRAVCLTDFPEDLGQRARQVIVESYERQVMSLVSVRPHGHMLVLHLEGVESIEQAQALRGAHVKISRSQAHALPAGHYYVSDIVGLEAFTEDGRSVGKVLDVHRTGSNDVYHCERALVPAIRDAVTEIDLSGGRIIVNSALIVEEE